MNVIYNDGVIEIGLSEGDPVSDPLNFGMRWLDPGDATSKSGTVLELGNIMGGETDWFLLPHSLATAVASRLVEQRAAGLNGFVDEGYNAMVLWLVENGEIYDGMAY